ncbi:MAG: AAA family ATPase [Deltaproteobacteria bacterium]|nr:AAA family ATPase [Deltaproteobacteria bacterium]
MTEKPTELRWSDLICACDPEQIGQRKVPQAAPTLPGQERGLKALAFGLAVKEGRFNITVTGMPLSGKTPTVHRLVEDKAQGEPPGQDICLRQNYTNPQRPLVLYLSPGQGKQVNRYIEELLSLLDRQIPNLLEQPAVKANVQRMKEAVEAKEQALSKEVETFAESLGMVVQTTSTGVNLIPLVDGHPMKEEEYLSLTVEERQRFDERRKELLGKMAEVNPKLLALDREKRETIDAFIEQQVSALVREYVSGMRKLLEETPPLGQFLEELEREIVDKRFLFLAESAVSTPFGGMQVQALRQQFLKNSRLNILVDRSGENHAPMVVELSPTYVNLIGGVDYTEEHGVLKTDFSQIRAGSLLQASGGYLILQAIDLVQQPMAYQALKRALRAGRIKLQDQLAEYGLRSHSHMEPELIEFRTKVILIGDEDLIGMIRVVDDEFDRLFKIQADFSGTLARTPALMDHYVDYLLYQSQRQNLLPLEAGAVARLVEESGRAVSHQNRLSAQMIEIMDILTEADTLARLEGQTSLDRAVVAQALDNRDFRHSKIEELVKREIREGTILLDFEGGKVGQVNGLAVYQVGQTMFGVPTRITAQAYAGRAGLINIEREADLSGRIHTKGVLILNGYLGKLFAQKNPLALSVSICFEQNYGLIEGDSATVAEFLATLSALSGVPVLQNIAVTGSMNQHGEIQPIGGVNEKVRGFYEFVKDAGFPTGCGVMIPYTNRVNLMLSDDIIQAVKDEKFHIYTIRRVEEGVALMTGLPAGELGPEGTYPEGTLYAKAMAQLTAFAKSAKESDDDEESEEGEGITVVEEVSGGSGHSEEPSDEEDDDQDDEPEDLDYPKQLG